MRFRLEAQLSKVRFCLLDRRHRIGSSVCSCLQFVHSSKTWVSGRGLVKLLELIWDSVLFFFFSLTKDSD